MWEILLLHVGRISDEGIGRTVERYMKMVGGEWKLRVEPVRASRKKEPQACKKEEAGFLARRIPKGCLAVALDPGGRTMDSDGFAGLLQRQKDSGRRVAFLVGGPHGLGHEALDLAELRLSLSPMTLSHDMATLVLAEQIYRAFAHCTGRAYAK
jgi:23S rRNA (pseudouridine1915-N3)-methyltransferase